MAIKILPELSGYFKGKVHKWTEQLLEESIKETGGAMTPVIVWAEEGVLIDGHRRLEVCERLGLPYKVQEMSFKDLEQVKEFMKSWQFCRRNVTDHMFSMAVAKAYKKSKGERSAKAPTKTFPGEPSAVQQVADKFGVSYSTVLRDAEFGEAVEKLGPEVAEKIIKGEIKCSKPDAVALSKESPEEVGRIVEGVKAGSIKSVKDAVSKKTPSVDRMLLAKNLKELLGRLASKLNELREIDRAKYFEIREHVANIGFALEEWEATLV